MEQIRYVVRITDGTQTFALVRIVH